MIYLATPYTHPSSRVRERRLREAQKAAYYLATVRHLVVYSPIAHWHSAAEALGVDVDYATWEQQNLGMLRIAEWLYVLTTSGTHQSQGIAWEVEWAEKLNIPITRFILPESAEWLK